MIAATVTLTTSGVSLRTLIDAATPGQLNTISFYNNRVCEVQLEAETGTFHIVYKPGTVVLATDSGFEGNDTTIDTTGASNRIVFRCPTSNQLSLADIYVAGVAGGELVRVVAYTL